MNRKAHWEHIYETKDLKQVSWYQSKPEISLQLINKYTASKQAKIIDVGGGHSFLVDFLLAEGFENLTVLDISAQAIALAKERLGEEKAAQVNWIVADITEFLPTETYDVWHDRAAFHFLSAEEEINYYKKAAHRALTEEGKLIVGSFSHNGPTKCSGIEVTQYSPAQMESCFHPQFEKKECFTTDHNTPSGSVQNFTFCCFEKSDAAL